MHSTSRKLSRRSFVARSTAAAAGSFLTAKLGELAASAEVTGTRQAMGVKVGELTDHSAIVWMRQTANATRNQTGQKIVGKVGKNPKEVTAPVSELHGACPGAPGQLRFRYGTREDLSGAQTTPWIDATAQNDFTHEFEIKSLKPDTVYHYAAETAGDGGKTKHVPLLGRFQTAPAKSQPSNFTFCVITCQGYHDMDHEDGFHIYPAMQKLNPRFTAFMGDNVYYDSDEPRATSLELARYHWQRMYSMPRHVELLRNTGSYWAKDDHDTWDNDSWPSMKTRRMGQFTFEEGRHEFLQQAPIGDSIYRTFRWGRDLQIWFTDGRDFRSPNNMKDGPEKSIWGSEQKAWLKRTVKESDATWKILISPTPIVGPDRGNKNDNHANVGFTHEGDEIRHWFQQNVPDNLFVINGDRHWQYHSVHPETGLNEFSVGAASDAHASGSPGEDKTYHRFHLVKGGFLSVDLKSDNKTSKVTCRLRNVFGKPVYEWSKTRTV